MRTATADDQLFARLAPVRSRLRCNRMIRASGWGLLLGATVALGIVAAGLWLPMAWSVEWVAAAVTVGLGLGTAIGAMRLHDWHAAAQAVDAAGGGDRVRRALELTTDPHRTAMHEIQLIETARYLERLDLRRYRGAHRRWPIELGVGVLLTVGAFVLLGVDPQVLGIAVEPPPVATIETPPDELTAPELPAVEPIDVDFGPADRQPRLARWPHRRSMDLDAWPKLPENRLLVRRYFDRLPPGRQGGAAGKLPEEAQNP